MVTSAAVVVVAQVQIRSTPVFIDQIHDVFAEYLPTACVCNGLYTLVEVLCLHYYLIVAVVV